MNTNTIFEYSKGHSRWNEKEMELIDWWEIFDVALNNIKEKYNKLSSEVKDGN